MNRRIIFAALILIIVFGSFLLNGREKDVEDVAVAGAQSEGWSENDDASLSKAQVRQAGAVDIEAVPIQLEPGKEAIIELSLNTHSVELDYDYTEISYIEDNIGNKYQALKWSGEKGGHHLRGTIAFEKLDKNVQSVTLTISGVDNQDMFFEWEL